MASSLQRLPLSDNPNRRLYRSMPTRHAIGLVVVICLWMTPSSAFVVHSSQQRSWSKIASSPNDEDSIPSFIQSPVLKQVYPALQEHMQQYGNPNIPLGTPQGRQCQTLRRLHIQQKLTDPEVQLLESIGFYFHSLEDVYQTADFDDLYGRLLDYRQQQHDESWPPKKYPSDPELGAWVTGLRRLGPAQVDPEHADRLNAIDFAWKSDRKCGSAFMQQYRAVRERIQVEGAETVWQDAAVQQWVQAQREAVKRQTLSETRQHYMVQLVGEGWLEG